MKVTTLKGQTLNVRISHLDPEQQVKEVESLKLEFKDDPKKLKRLENVNRITVCSVKDGADNPMSQSRSICAKPDQFFRKVGTCQALKRALVDAGLDRADRKSIFKQIFHTKGK